VGCEEVLFSEVMLVKRQVEKMRIARGEKLNIGRHFVIQLGDATSPRQKHG
jgi:hypothetical protein